MDDLSGLSWASKPDSVKETRPYGLPSPAFVTLRPNPPGSERSSPSTNALSNGPPYAQAPANDSFSNLVSFSSAPTNKNLSLQEQQKKLLEKKAQQQAAKHKQVESHYNGGDEQFWNNLGSSGRTTPAAPGHPSVVSGTQSPSQRGSDRNGTTNGGSSQPNPDDEEADILAAFKADAAVDSSSHFPKPFERVDGSIDASGQKSSPVTMLGDAGKGLISQELSAFDDDDPFGLAELPKRHFGRPPESTPQNEEEEDVLGLLAKPVSELPRHQTADSPPIQAERQRVRPQDQAMAELMEMGFPAEKAIEALESTETGTDVQQAVGWLLNKAHLESRGKARPGQSSNEDPGQSRDPRIDRRSGSRPSAVQSGGSKPARSNDQSREKPVCHASTVPANQPDRDPAQMATELGTAFFKTAGSFWKNSTKKVQQAVQDFNSDSDSSQPKWMRELGPSRSGQGADHRNGQRTTAPPRRRISAKKEQESVTDEAMMLESDRARLPPRKPQKGSEASLDSSADNSRDHSPAMPSRFRQGFPAQPTDVRQQKFKPQTRPDSKSALNHQAIDDQASQAYISSARRRKPASRTPISESEPDLLDNASQHQPSHPSRPATTGPSQHARPFQPPMPTTVHPPFRNIPPISSISLKASHADREAGNNHFKRGDYSSARESYTSSLKHLPSDHPIAIILHTNRAVAALKIGEAKSAILDSERAIAVIGPSRGEAESIDLKNGEHAKPMRGYFGKALMRKAEALEQMEKWKEAAAVWQEAVEGGHGGATSIQGRIRCGKAAVPQQPQPAKPPFKKSITSIPTRTATSHLNGTADAMPPAAAVNRLRAANDAADRLDDEKFTLADAVDARLAAWKGGKAENLRALLGSLDTVLWPEADWKKIGMADLVLPAKVKVQYMKGIAKVHPDKVSCRQDAPSTGWRYNKFLMKTRLTFLKLPTTATTEQRMVAGAVFSTLNEAWDKFKNENGL
jgi:tetratricopeptide (TPR) repeat protein